MKLAELRKEALARHTERRPRGADVRSTSYRPEPPRSTYPSRGERVVPQYEERRPDYAATPDYFTAQPRTTVHKEPDYTERPTPKRAAESKEKPRGFTRSSKDSDKERRKEKVRQAERDVRKERERKQETYVEDDSESELDDYQRRARRMREEDAARRARDASYQQMPRSQRDAPEVYHDERARKMADHYADARDYINSTRGAVPRPKTEERRPSPVRMESSKDRLQSVKLDRSGRPAGFVRRSSERPGKDSRDEKKREKESTRKTSSRTPERRSSAETVDERRPPPLNTSKSSPPDMHMASEKQRAASLQPGSTAMPPPPVKRSDTTPQNTSARRGENVPPKTSRATEFINGQPTPATTPDHQAPPHAKAPYGSRPYADDAEYATPEGYRTSNPQERTRPAFTRRVTRSPSPTKEAPREPLREYPSRNRESMYDTMPRSREVPSREMPRSREVPQAEAYGDPRDARDTRQPSYRASSARYPDRPQSMSMNPRKTSYRYTPGTGAEQVSRMAPAKEPFSREYGLYGETPSTRSPQQRPNEDVRHSKSLRPEFKMQSGYSYTAHPSGERPQVSRNHSGGVYQSARAA